MRGVPECLACGVCCTSRSPMHARVTGDDWSRLGEEAERWTTWIGNRAYMRIAEGRCAALEVRSDGFSCAIYDRRPEVCRALERGSPACEAEIMRKQDEVRRRLPIWSRAARE